MHISKVKFIKGGNQVALTFTKIEADKTSTDVTEIHRAPAHIDFRAAVQSLAIHFAILADYVAPKQVKMIDKYEPKLIEGFIVSGYSIGGDEDDRGITITGHKLKSNGKAIILNTPFTRFVEAEESQYQFIDHLEGRIAEVEREVNLYIGGKRAPEPQLSLDLPEDSQEEEEDTNDGEDDDYEDQEVKVVKMPSEKSIKKNAPKKPSTKTKAAKKSK